ncbi:MAG TPA: hypothetical protein VK335_11230 [Bryobacteraceae bacterium]|nr:hypothetical protein [Bryobacteraceae bacterium]
MNQSTHRKFPCERRERLFKYMAQTVKALIEAQEEQGIPICRCSSKVGHSFGRGFGTDLIAAATAWKSARLAYEQHVREHGCLEHSPAQLVEPGQAEGLDRNRGLSQFTRMLSSLRNSLSMKMARIS